MGVVGLSQRVAFRLVVLSSLLLLLAVVVAAAVSIGSVPLGFTKVWLILASHLPGLGAAFPVDIEPVEEVIVFAIRLPRVLLAALVGGALAGAGTAFQGLFRNPMAEPYVIGISSGAALGATLALILRWDVVILGLRTVPFFAFVGSVLTTIVVLSISRTEQRVPITVLLLAGIAVGSFLQAINSLLLVFNREDMQEIIFWTMGGFAGRGWQHLSAALPYIVLGLAVLIWHGDELNILAMGEEKAQQLGLDLRRTHLVIIGAAALMTAAAVSVSGIIGFVGLVVPHIMRLITGPDHRFLLPVSLVAGAAFLVAADTLARTILAPMELPVGVITALAGAPFFLYLLRKSRYVWK